MCDWAIKLECTTKLTINFIRYMHKKIVLNESKVLENVRIELTAHERLYMIYIRKAILFHRPRVQIVESSRPAFAAVVAAPLQKLWSAKY